MSNLPKVSGVLPVGCGERFFRVAMTAFLSQSYDGELELVVVDNSDVPIKALLPADDRIKYVRCDRMPVGALRNLGASHATGEIIVSLDEDDWSHSDRVGEQVGRLIGTGKAVTGFHSIWYYDTSDQGTYQYRYSTTGGSHPPYACGSSQCYRRTWWETHPFPETGIEDFPFQQAALNANQLDSIDGAELLVARARSDSTCFPTQLGRHRQFPAVPKDSLPAEFYAAIAPPATKPKAKSQPKSNK